MPSKRSNFFTETLLAGFRNEMMTASKFWRH